MGKANITPQNVQLTEMKSATFECQDDQGAPLPVTWTTAPTMIGTIPPAGAPSTSITYTAPQQVKDAQAIIITATAGADTASTTVFLTPIVVQIIPAAVQLKPTQPQQFTAIVAGDPTNRVTWGLSPQVGNITPSGLYTPDPSLIDSAAVRVTAISALGSKSANASVTLVPSPWSGWKRNLLGFYLLGIFSLVFLLVALWPPPQPDSARTAARTTAQAIVEEDARKFEADAVDFEADTKKLKIAQDAVEAGKSQPKDSLDKLTAALTDAQKTKEQDDKKREQNDRQKEKDDKSLEAAKKAESASVDVVARPGASVIEGRPGANLPRDIDLLFLVLIGGALGAFLHSARSFTDFVGNEEIKDRKSTRLNSSHELKSRMPSSA